MHVRAKIRGNFFGDRLLTIYSHLLTRRTASELLLRVRRHSTTNTRTHRHMVLQPSNSRMLPCYLLGHISSTRAVIKLMRCPLTTLKRLGVLLGSQLVLGAKFAKQPFFCRVHDSVAQNSVKKV